MTSKRAPIGPSRQADYELGGLTEEESGRLARPVSTESLLRPDVVRADFRRGNLSYDTSSTLVSDVITTGLLDEFVRLLDAPDEKILEFAQARGVLSVRAFRKPRVYRERFAEWRLWSRCARATLDIAAALNRDDLAPERAWLELDGWWLDVWRKIAGERRNVSSAQALLDAERLQLQDVINRWFREAELRPYYSGAAGRIVFTNIAGLDEGSLSTLGAVAVQVALAASGAQSLAVCSACGIPYARKGRRASIGLRNYCPTCKKSGKHWRDAQRDKRAGKSKPRKKRQQGGKHGKTTRTRRG